MKCFYMLYTNTEVQQIIKKINITKDEIFCFSHLINS